MKYLTNLTDHQLVHLYVEGNTNALEVLIHRYKDRIFSAIYLIVKDKYMAEDLFQEIFIRVIDTIKSGKYAEEGKFLPWVLRIAHNMCVDHFRKIKRSPSILTSDDRDIFDVLKFSVEDAENSMMRSQKHERVRKMIDMLPEDQREVIILRHYADLNFKEIAEITHCSINTALGRMRYGLINMRKIITDNQIVF